MENAEYVFAAFTIVWILVFGYILYLFNKQKSLRKEIDSLTELLGQKDDK